MVKQLHTHHTTTHSSLASVTDSIEHEREHEYVTCSYDSVESICDHLIYISQQQGLFAALSLAKEINSLNGYKVVSDWQIAQIKKHFSKNKNKSNDTYSTCHNRKNEFVEKESSFTDTYIEGRKQNLKKENRNAIKHYRNENKDSTKNINHEYQKAYMKLLSR